MQVLVIGDGIVGLGIARDLALRGFDTKVVDRDEFGSETSTHFHGDFHSGARYAVKEPEAAKSCIRENKILRDIADPYIRYTGGIFLKREEDSEEYFQEKLEMCEKCGIEIEVVSGEELREDNTAYSGEIEKGIKVPEGVFKPLQFMKALRVDAERHGAEFVGGEEVNNIVVSDGVVQSVETYESCFDVDLVVNAAGPWAGKIAEMAGTEMKMSPTKGIMTVVDCPDVDLVLNRCKPVDDGDIIVPIEDRVILGTTSEEVDDPDDFERNEDEKMRMLEEGKKMIPELSEEDIKDSFWGLRPIYDSSDTIATRDMTRGYTVLDHEKRDGIKGLITTVGGKWTTHRKMAEVTVDLICEKHGVERECKTAEKELPEIEEVNGEWPPEQEENVDKDTTQLV